MFVLQKDIIHIIYRAISVGRRKNDCRKEKKKWNLYAFLCIHYPKVTITFDFKTPIPAFFKFVYFSEHLFSIFATTIRKRIFPPFCAFHVLCKFQTNINIYTFCGWNLLDYWARIAVYYYIVQLNKYPRFSKNVLSR